MKIKPLLLLFGIISVAEIYAEIMNNIQLIYVVKPLLMISLSLFYYLNLPTKSSRFNYFILLGLIFSIGGDTFLMFKGSQFFMAGLGCFLVTHIFYILGFQHYQKTTTGFIRHQKWLLVPFVLYLLGILSYLWDNLNDLKIPVVIYSLVICSMAVAALNLKNKMPSVFFYTLFLGVLLFLFSDSVIALNKFAGEGLQIPYPRLMIMITYILAQLLIAISTLKSSSSASHSTI
jgi:uncharacterized membrane protein YhhN